MVFLTCPYYNSIITPKFHGGGDHGVGKPGNGYQGSGSGMLGNAVKYPDSREERRRRHERDGGHSAGLILFHPRREEDP